MEEGRIYQKGTDTLAVQEGRIDRRGGCINRMVGRIETQFQLSILQSFGQLIYQNINGGGFIGIREKTIERNRHIIRIGRMH